MSSRIGWIPSSSDPAIASVRLRSILPCRYLREAGWDCGLVGDGDPFGYDLVVFQKIYDEESIELARSLRARGVRTVFDLCDNHLYVPDGHPKLAARAERLARMLDAVDAVSVSTQPLAEHVPGKLAGIVDDALDEVAPERPVGRVARLRERLRPERRLRLVWYGNAGAEAPSFGLPHLARIVPVLEELHGRTPLRLAVISNSRQAYERVLAGARFPSEYHDWDSRGFPQLFRANDVCVIPIEVNPFTVCKTANRVALALRLGVPVIADRIPSFDELAPHVVLDDWEAGLARYAADRALRERDAREGRAHVERTYTRERVVGQWSGVLERVLAMAAPPAKVLRS